jgi:hypothetical protein
MDGFSQLLDEFFELCIQVEYPRFSPAGGRPGARLNCPYLTSDVPGGQPESDKLVNFFPMEPNTVGRKLGIGVRVASRMLLDRAAQSGSQPQPATAPSQKQAVPTSQVYADRGKTAVRGARKFGESIWRPFVHASGVLWLEVTGLFFGIFTLFFGMNAFKLRYQWQMGHDHRRFLVYSVVTLAFTYFTFSSFYRARKKQQRGNR